MQNNIILFDIDHTLFNTDMYLEMVFDRLAQFFAYTTLPNITNMLINIYQEMRKTEIFHPERFAELVVNHLDQKDKKQSVIDMLVDQSLLEECIYSEIPVVLGALLKKDIRIGIFSTGDKDFQQRKIYSLRRFFDKKDIHIFPLKDKEIIAVLNQYKKKKVTFVDDRMQVLEEITEHNSPLTTIWIRRKNAKYPKPSSLEFTPTYHIATLEDILDLNL